MQLLRKLYQCLLKYLKGDKTNSPDTGIPNEISDDEIIVRGILKPLFLRKNKLEDKAFLPPPKDATRMDVSVLRYNYTDADFCKNHAASLKIKDTTYEGLAVLLAKSIEQVNNEESYFLANGERLQVSIKATPNLVENLPMHADIIYSHSLVDDEPKILMRILAKKLIKKSKFLKDPFPTTPDWKGEEINHHLFDEQ